MLQEQINALQDKEDGLLLKIKLVEEDLKKTKLELTAIKKAKQSLERLEEQLNGQADISE